MHICFAAHKENDIGVAEEVPGGVPSPQPYLDCQVVMMLSQTLHPPPTPPPHPPYLDCQVVHDALCGLGRHLPKAACAHPRTRSPPGHGPRHLEAQQAR